ncbi:hypothetical protein C8Q76DRAFT_490264 [Earliella scabrosa]|nr:hypothetical protein C8Q76DRAFT_490264 [Earliella scabrosa]
MFPRAWFKPQLMASRTVTVMEPTPFFQIPALDNTYGAILMGSNISLILYGFNLHQAYRYFRQFPNDSRFVKLVVWLVLGLESMNSAFYMHISYNHLVTNYFNPIELTFASWSLDSMPMAAGLSIMTSQCFFIRRVYKLGGISRVVAYLAMILLVVEFAFCMAATVEAFIQPSFEAYRSVTWLISAAFGVIVLTDGMLTATLIVALRNCRTGFRRTDSLIDILVLYAITTGALTTVVNLAAFFFALILPDNLIYVGVNIVAGKLYVLSLFAALNSRIDIANHGATAMVYGSGGTVIPTRSVNVPETTWRFARPTETRSSVLDVSMTDSHLPAKSVGLGTDELQGGTDSNVFEMHHMATRV